MNFTVKNTTFRSILDLIYPCYCRGCGKFGETFCFRCYNYNRALNPPFSRRLDPDFHKLFVCGLREGMLSLMISEYKFQSCRHFAPVLAKMISELVSELPLDTIIVPIPTVSRHIRSRGFDHIGVLCSELAKLTGFSVVPLLSRRRETVQVGKSSKTRRFQAREAFSVDLEGFKGMLEVVSSDSKVDFQRPILIVDDVWTTGASMRSASFLLRSAGFQKVYGVVLAKNNGYEFDK